LSLIRDDEGRPQVMQGLAFIELTQEAAPILRMGIPMHNVERAGQASVLL
jgi:hypothetical protein